MATDLLERCEYEVAQVPHHAPLVGQDQPLHAMKIGINERGTQFHPWCIIAHRRKDEIRVPWRVFRVCPGQDDPEDQAASVGTSEQVGRVKVGDDAGNPALCSGLHAHEIAIAVHSDCKPRADDLC